MRKLSNHSSPLENPVSRRGFVSSCGAALTLGVASNAFAAPAIVTGKRTQAQGEQEVVIGKGDFQYKVSHAFCQLPDRFTWQTTHNVCVDAENNLYVIHEGQSSKKDHPAIFVFDSTGKFVRAFGSQFQGGGHGIEIRKEGTEEFLYVAAYQGVKSIAKMTLDGSIVWYRKAPMESGVYDEGEDTSTKSTWTRKGFLPTNFTFLDDGGFLLADGYGTYFIHEYDADGNWKRCFGGPGEGKGKFNLCHGLWLDDRPGREANLYVTDRSVNTVQVIKLDGTHVETKTDYVLPANVDTYRNLMVIPELGARITILNEKDEIVARLDEGVERLEQFKDKKLREQPDQWKDGHFVHPHDACFDLEGNLFVAEWVKTGRVTKLTKV